MPDVGWVRGTIVGFEKIEYGEKIKDTGEVRKPGTMHFVWLSSENGEGACVPTKCWPEQYADAEALGFGAEVRALVEYGTYNNRLDRQLRKIEAAVVSPAAVADAG